MEQSTIINIITHTFIICYIIILFLYFYIIILLYYYLEMSENNTESHSFENNPSAVIL